MGHKVSPVAFRLQINKNWQSKWFSRKNYRLSFLSDIEIRRVLEKKFGKTAGVAGIEIARAEDAIKVIIRTSKPGILIGRSGQGIDELKLHLIKHCPTLRDPKTGKAVKKIEIEVMEIKSPYLSAELVAQNVAYQIERRIAHKRAIKQALTKVMEAKAKGVKIGIAGRLGGAEIARREHYGSGSVPLGRLRADVDFAQKDALTTYGIVGVKVWIYKGDQMVNENED